MLYTLYKMLDIHIVIHIYKGATNSLKDDHSSLASPLFSPTLYVCLRLAQLHCYIVGLSLNCKFIDLLFKRSVIKFIKIGSFPGFIVSEIIYSQTDTLT